MSIRIPHKADIDTQNCFRDIEQALAELKATTDRLNSGSAATDISTLRADLDRVAAENRLPDDRAVFVASGPMHAVGLVPDPGATAGTSRYLREDGAWTSAGRLNSQSGSVGNSAGVYTDLYTYNLPAGLLATDGQMIRLTAWGTTAANGNTKAARLYFGSTLVLVKGDTVSGAGWVVRAVVIRKTATTQDMAGDGVSNAASGVAAFASPAETLANSITVKVAGFGDAANDILGKGFLVEALL